MSKCCSVQVMLRLFFAVMILGSCGVVKEDSFSDAGDHSNIDTPIDSDEESDNDTQRDSDNDHDSSTDHDTDIHSDTDSDTSSDVDTDADGDTADANADTVMDSDSEDDTVIGTDTGTDPNTDIISSTNTDAEQPVSLFDILPGGYVYAGEWHGSAWTSTGDVEGSTITPTDYSNLTGDESALCVTGTLAESYDAFAIIGLNVNQANADEAVLMSWTPSVLNTGIYVDISNSGGSIVRLAVETSDGRGYCTGISAGGETVNWTDLVENCWETGGAEYSGAPIERVMLVAPGDQQSAVAYAFCLNEMYPVGSTIDTDTGENSDTSTGADTESDDDTETGTDTNQNTDTAQDTAIDTGTEAETHAGMKIGTNFWNLGWGIWDDTFKSDATFSEGSDPWNPAFVEEIRPYAALRFMDWAETNGSSEQTWDDRTQPNSSQQNPLAWEWMIDLCNKIDRDIWVTLPHRSDANYSYQLALIIEERLDPELKVYVEWSNETWNTIFSQTDWAYERGNALGLDSDPWSAAFKYQVYAAVRVFEQFETVFGVDSPRIVKVVAGQTGNNWTTELHLNALNDSEINPNGITADAYATAPYFGHNINGNDGSAIANLRSSMESSVDDVVSQSVLVAQAGLRFLAYEGGQHVYEGGADLINSRPEMYQIYIDYFDGVAPYFDLFMHYLHNGQWDSGGAWGAEEYVGQPLSEAHKLRAIYDWIDTNAY